METGKRSGPGNTAFFCCLFLLGPAPPSHTRLTEQMAYVLLAKVKDLMISSKSSSTIYNIQAMTRRGRHDVLEHHLLTKTPGSRPK